MIPPLILISQGCRDQGPRAGGSQTDALPRTSGGWKPKVKASAGLAPSEAEKGWGPGVWAPSSPCALTVFLLHAAVSRSPFAEGHQSDGIRTRPSDLTLAGLLCKDPLSKAGTF